MIIATNAQVSKMRDEVVLEAFGGCKKSLQNTCGTTTHIMCCNKKKFETQTHLSAGVFETTHRPLLAVVVVAISPDPPPPPVAIRICHVRKVRAFFCSFFEMILRNQPSSRTRRVVVGIP